MSHHSFSLAEICQTADRVADLGLLGRVWPSAGARHVERAVRHFTHLVYAIDERVLRHWSPSERHAAEGAVQTAIANVEGYLARPASRRAPRIAQRLVERVYQLNAAIEGLSMGLAADPERRPFGWHERRRT